MMENVGPPPAAPPCSTYSYFIKTFFKNKSRFHKKRKLADATRLWRTLSGEERDKLRVGLEESKRHYEERYAQYLAQLEPYLKKKPEEKLPQEHSAEKECDSQKEPTPTASDETSVISSGRSSLQADYSIGNCTRLEDETEPTIDKPNSPSRLEDSTVQAIDKPNSPPKDAKELYAMINEDTMSQDQCLEAWQRLSNAQKSRYRNAVKSLKNDYLEKYKLYLLSLPTEELSQHLEERI